MKKILKYLVPLLGLIVLMAGCNNGASLGEKKTVSEVDQLLTKKGQTFYDDKVGAELTVTKPYQITVKDKSGTGDMDNVITLKKSGTTSDGKYAIYKLSSENSDGVYAYSYSSHEIAAIFVKKVNGKRRLVIYTDIRKNLTTKTIEKAKNNNIGIKIIE